MSKEEEKLANDIDPEEVKIVSSKFDEKMYRSAKEELEESGIKLDIKIDHNQ